MFCIYNIIFNILSKCLFYGNINANIYFINENDLLFYDFSFRLVLGLETQQKESHSICVDVFRKIPGTTQ